MLMARSWRLRQLVKRPGGRLTILLWSRDREDKEDRGPSTSPGSVVSRFSDSMKMCRFLNIQRKFSFTY